MENVFQLRHKEGICRFCDQMREDNKKGTSKDLIDSLLEQELEPRLRLRDLGPGPSLGTVAKKELGPREVDDDDLRRNNIPLNYKSASILGVQDKEVRDVIARYLNNLSDMIKSCTGLLIVGKQGVGKSAVASMIAIEALRNRFSVFVATHTLLQELRFDNNPAQNTDGQSAVDRIKNCDLLILDDFNESFLTDKVFGPAKLESLISERNRWLRTTIMTTRLLRDSFQKDPLLKSVYGLMQETMVGMVITGSDLRQLRNKEMKNRLGISK